MRARLALLLAAASFILCICLPPAWALTDMNTGAAQSCADALKSLGLFNGTDAGYELERAPTRAEATAFLVRLLNQESEAQAGDWSFPFRDVPDWAAPYVGYAYENKIVNGVSAARFGAADAMSAAMYLTLVLRVLGYSDADGDFSWDAPYDLARDVGILPDTADTDDFMRGDAVLISWAALSAKLKGKTTTLASKLISAGAFTSSELSTAKKTAEAAPRISQGRTSSPPKSGSDVLSNGEGSVDTSNTADGTVRVAYTGTSSARIKAILTLPDSTRYTYNLTKGVYAVLPLSGGSGKYTIGIYVNVSGTKYATAYSTTFQASLSSEFAPFLVANQYVNYTSSGKAAQLAAELTSKSGTELDKIRAVFGYAVENISYDKERAASVQSGYIPDIDDVLRRGKGICFDYAAVMTAMLRSLGIPTKLVIGYAGDVYHAWISTYTEESGWLDEIIYFDGKQWKLLDPTFTSGGSEEYTADASHYSAKYTY